MNLNKNEKEELGGGQDYDSLPELREFDPEFVEILKSCSPPPPPISNTTKQNIIDSYSENYKYRILWREIKIKALQFLGSVFFVPRLKPVMVLASVVLLFAMGVSLYYWYQNGTYTTPSLTSNKETPTIKIETPPTPLPTPEIAPKTNPFIAENNSNRRNERNQKSKTVHKPESIESLKLEENKLALNKPTQGKSTETQIRKLGEKGNTDSSNLTNKGLHDISIVMVSDSVESGIRQDIEKEIIESGKWKLAEAGKDGEATFKVVNDSLMLVNESGKILWQDAKYKENFSNNPNYLKSLIKLLTK